MIFTNYQFYVDGFVQAAPAHIASGEGGYESFVEPGNAITRKAGLRRHDSGTSSGCRRCRPIISDPAIPA